MTKKNLLFVDHFDSFSENIIAFFRAESFNVTHLQSAELPQNPSDAFVSSFSGIIFSPGPKRPSDYERSIALYHSLPNQMPVLGICLGHQLMLHADGATVEQIHTNPIHGRRLSLEFLATRLLQPGPFAGTAIFYNSLGVSDKDAIFKTSKWHCINAVDNWCVVAEHTKLPRLGLQFHPESFASTIGTKILRSFTNVCLDFGR